MYVVGGPYTYRITLDDRGAYALSALVMLSKSYIAPFSPVPTSALAWYTAITYSIMLRGFPYMTSAGGGGRGEDLISVDLTSGAPVTRGGGQKIQFFCGYPIWMPPLVLEVYTDVNKRS